MYPTPNVFTIVHGTNYITFLGSGVASTKWGGSHSKLVAAAAPYTQNPFSTQCVNINNVNSGMFGIRVSAAGEEVNISLINL